MNNSVSLVISKYNENIGWINDYKDFKELKIYVYDKFGSFKTKQDNVISIQRPNLGREAETYLYHIIENYDNLSDLIIFTQAYPFDNIPLFFNYLDQDLDLKEFKKYFNWYGERILSCDENGSPGIYPIESGHPNDFNRTLKSIYEEVFSKKCPNKIVYKPNASFSVSKDLVLKYSKETYKKLITYLNYKEQENYQGIFKYNPYEGHIIERMWGLMYEFAV